MVRPIRTVEEQEQIDKWLSKNEVTVFPAGERTDPDKLTYKWKRGGRKKQTDQGVNDV